MGLTGFFGGGGGAWTPASLTPTAWFRADAGNTTTWTDNSGNGHDATWSAAPTATTLGGQAAWDMSGGKHADGAAALISVGSASTVLAVGKALDAIGGCVFQDYGGASLHVREALLFTAGGVTYHYSDAIAALDTIADAHVELASPFLSEHSYSGTGIAPLLRLNRSDRTSTRSDAQVAENGTAAFMIGQDAAAQLWNGVLAEVVIVPRQLTAGERANWEAYVLARYGI